MLQMVRSLSASRALARVALVVLPLLAACGDSTAPTRADVAGTYTATVFRVAAQGQPVEDVLADGGSITLVLGADGSTSGELVIPAAATEDGVGFTEDLTGSYVLTERILTLEQAADTFLRDIEWSVDDDRLSGAFTSSGGTITVVLSRVS